MHLLAVDWGVYLHDYGCWAVFAVMVLENAGVPMPGTSTLVAAAALAGRGRLALPVLLLTAWVGATAGTCLGYAIGRWGGHRAVVRWGRYVRVTDARLSRAEGFFVRRGGPMLVVARFLPVLRELSGITAGTLEMPWRSFVAYNAAGAAVWVAFWGLLAYEVSEDTKWLAAHWVPLVIVGGALAVAVGALYVLYRRRRGKGPAERGG